MLAEANHYRDRFRQLNPFNRFASDQQDQAFSDVEVLEFREGEVVFDQGSRDGYTYYLLDGTLDLFADGKGVKRVVSGTEASLNPIGHIQPRRAAARAGSGVTVLRLKRGVIDELLSLRQAAATASSAPPAEQSRSDTLSPVHADGGGLGKVAFALKPQLFSKLPPSSLPGLFAAMELVKCKAATNVIRQGDVGDYYYIIKEGSCEVRRTTSVSAHGIKLAELKPGEAFGEDALISNMRRNATVRMITDGELIRIAKEDFVQFIRKPLLRNVSFEQGTALVREGAFWIDVRFPEECGNGALAGSVNIPLNILRIHASRLDPRKKYVVYCDDGSRSAVAAFILRERGFDSCCVEGGCARELAAFFAIEGAALRDPDLTATAIPRHEAMQETVPLPGPLQGNGLIDLEALNFTSGGEQMVVVAEPPDLLTAAPAFADESPEDTVVEAEGPTTASIAPPGQAPSGAQPAAEAPASKPMETASPAATGRPALEQMQARIDEYVSQARGAAERMHSQDASLQYAHAKLRDYETETETLRAEVARLKQALSAAGAKFSDHDAALRQYREQIKAYDDTLRKSSEVTAERDQLAQSYRGRIEELERVLAARTEAEALLGKERQQLVGELAEQKRLLEETRRQMRETPAQEQHLQTATQTQLAELRKILGAEFARNAALVDLARQERRSAEAARQRLVRQTEMVIADYRARNEKVRVQEEARLREERRLLELEREFLKSATEAAANAREQTETMLRRAGEQTERLRALMNTEIDAIESDVAKDMKRVQEAAALEQERAQSARGEPTAEEVEQSRLQEVLEHQVDDLLTDEAAAPAASAKILDLQRQDIERIQKRAEEARTTRTGQDPLALEEAGDRGPTPAK